MFFSAVFTPKNKGKKRVNMSENEEDYKLEDYKLANQLIESLTDRGGFDDWWHNIDEDIQEEILGNLANKISTFKG